jgi:hypothetical protein
MNLPPDDIRNGAPIALVERIQGTKEQVSSLRLVSQGTHVLLQHDVHKPELWRHLCLAGGILVPVCKLPLTHVGDNVFCGDHGGADNPWFFFFVWLGMAFQSSRYVGSGHLDVFIVDRREKDAWLGAVILQIFIKGLDQKFICGGGNRFEQSLQTAVL